MTQAFNLSQFANNVDSTGKAILTSGQAVTGTLPVGNGGTGSTGLTQYGVVIGGGSSQLDTVSTTSPTTAAAGDLLVYQGSGLSPAWKTPSQGVNIEYITTTTLWTVPSGITKAFVWVFGGGGGGAYYANGGQPGGTGGFIAGYVTGLSGTVSITVGAGGAVANGAYSVGATGGTSSFGSYITSTGGTGGNLASYPDAAGTNGTGTLASGVTRIRILSGVELIPTTLQTGLTSGAGNVIWSTNYTAAPGTKGSGTPGYGTNGTGGAVILQY